MELREEKLLSIRLLGPPEVSFKEQPLQFRIKKALALLCYLAAEGGRPSRRELAELLWPQSEERRARADLRSALAKLRKALGQDSAHGEEVRFLVVDGDLLGLEPREIELDLEALEAAVSLARRETSLGRRGAADDGEARRDVIGRLQGDLGVYRGEFMEGFSVEEAHEFELWLEAERARWRGVFGELCERLSRLQGEEGLIGEAIGTARLWAGHAPLEETAHRRLMELLSSAGDGEGAFLAYEEFRDTLGRELGMEPSPQMQELAARLREEVEARSSLGASLVRLGATTTPLSLLEIPLAGRHKEFGALVSEYHATRMGQTRVAVVLGEAGIGKTRLVCEFLLWARAREADVLEGRAAEGGGLPYGPLVESIRHRIERERAPDDLLEDVWLSELSRLLPELKERYPDLPSSPSGERETAKGTLFEAITRLVGTLASRAPVVLFLDDLEWADAATLEVLDYAMKRWAEQEAPVLLLIAARPGEPEVSSTFERWLSSLGRRLPMRSLALGPLGNEDVKRLLGRLGRTDSTPDEALEGPGGSNEAESGLGSFVKWLAAETGGQPFYLVETLKALLEEGKLVIRSRADGETVMEVGPALRAGSTLRGLLPQSVREVIRARLSRLSSAASDLLRAGAVLGRGFGFESLVGVAGLGEAEGLRGLDELIERHLLREEAGGQEEAEPLYFSATYSFSHEKIREVAYTEGGRSRRRVLHRRAFEVLEERGASTAELARHARAGGLAEPSFGYSVAAGDAAMEVFAVKDAIEHYERARDLLAEEVGTGGRQLVEPSIQELEHLYTQLGWAYELTNEWGKARAAYETMLTLGRELGEARLGMVAHNHLVVLVFHQEAYDRIVQGRLREGVQIARVTLGMSRELHEQAEAMGPTALGLGLVEIGEYEEGLELCRRGTELARKAQNVALLWRNLDHLGRAYEALLDLEEARRVYEEALKLRGPLGPQYEVFSYIRLCAVAALSEDWEEAYAQALRAHQGRTSLDVLDGHYLYHEVEALVRGGDERLAREEVRRFAERAEVNERDQIAHLRSLAILSEWEGDTQRAIDHLREAEALAEKLALPGELWRIQAVLGEIYERRGETGEAREAFSWAAQTLRMLAGKIRDQELRKGFLSAPQVRRVLGHN
jgi:DNA-binding SARP family transcriptional activator/tetratricopeptide (TPR) repeat protein